MTHYCRHGCGVVEAAEQRGLAQGLSARECASPCPRLAVRAPSRVPHGWWGPDSSRVRRRRRPVLNQRPGLKSWENGDSRRRTRDLTDDPTAVAFLSDPTVALRRTYQDRAGQTLTLVLIANEGAESFAAFSHTPEDMLPWRSLGAVGEPPGLIPARRQAHVRPVSLGPA